MAWNCNKTACLTYRFSVKMAREILLLYENLVDKMKQG